MTLMQCFAYFHSYLIAVVYNVVSIYTSWHELAFCFQSTGSRFGISQVENVSISGACFRLVCYWLIMLHFTCL